MTLDTKLYPVYFLYGPEDYLIEKEIQRLLDRTLSPKERGMNLHTFNGAEHSSLEIEQAAQTLPMFSRYRFVLVKAADSIDEEKMAPLLKYIENPSPSTCLVLCAQTLGPWKKARSQIEKVGKIVESPRLKGKALISWMKNSAAEKGKTLSEEGAAYLLDVIGDHLYPLESSLEQVCLSVGEKKRIELPDIEGIVSEVKVSTVFDLTDAIGRRDVGKALGILGKTLESKNLPFKKDEPAKRRLDDPVPMLLSMMAKHYWNMMRVKKAASTRKSVSETAGVLGMPPWNVTKLLDQVKNFSETSLREGILKCHRTDLAVKKSRGPKDLLMEKLVIDLCHPNKT